MHDDIRENVIQWISGDDHVVCTFTQRKYISKIKKIAEKAPKFVSNLIENKDGSIYCHLNIKALRLGVIIREGNTFGKSKEEPEAGEEAV